MVVGMVWEERGGLFFPLPHEQVGNNAEGERESK